jgi:hypothetical protein
MAVHTKAAIWKAMWLRVAKSFGVGLIVLLGIILLTDPPHPPYRMVWAFIAFLVTLFFLRFRDDWYRRP